jgi:O-antigen ligase
MVKKIAQTKIPSNGIANWVFLGSAFITLYFNSKLQDPFNTPKLIILMLVASWCVPHLFGYISKRKIQNSQKLILFISVIFLFSGLVSTYFTDFRYTAIWGENQRRNGYLSYISLTIIFLTVVLLINSRNLRKFYLVSFITGLTLSAYGLLQNSGKDFVEWNNPYNSIISTVGNPNFAAAIMAVMATVIFGPILQTGYEKYIKVLSGILVLALICTIYLSDAKQGLVSIFVGLGFYISVWLVSVRKKIGIIFISTGLVGAILSVLGMLQIGPLEKFLYKESVTLRGYYWRAGIQMFKENFWFGVGIDRYGSYFKEVRDVTYPLKYGFDITSTNAHNVPIQFFATGGIFLGLSYLLLLGLVLFIGMKGIVKTSGQDRLIISSLLSAWLAFQAQSIVSIDNIGISTWGWLLSGLVCAISIEKTDPDKALFIKNGRDLVLKQVKLIQPIVSSTLVLLVLIPSVFVLRGENNMFQTRMRFNPTVPANNAPLKEYADKTINTKLVEPNYKITSASFLVVTGFTSQGMELLQELNKSDPRNLDTLLLLSGFSEQLGKPDLAIAYRLEIAKYDPWNAKNYLALGRIYKSLGDFNSMNQMLIKINSFASNTEEGKQANIDLVN